MRFPTIIIGLLCRASSQTTEQMSIRVEALARQGWSKDVRPLGTRRAGCIISWLWADANHDPWALLEGCVLRHR